MDLVSLQTGTVAGPQNPATAIGSMASPVLTADDEAAGAKGIQLTLRALKRIRTAMAKEGITPEVGGLRVGITGGGCSGLSYNIRFDSQPRERDRVYSFSQAHLANTDEERTGAVGSPPYRIFVDPKSFIYLHGMILDYEETLMRQGFNFINPNSTKSCGCGSSFSA
jgi:iron-sulfur cluster assembly protein